MMTSPLLSDAAEAFKTVYGLIMAVDVHPLNDDEGRYDYFNLVGLGLADL